MIPYLNEILFCVGVYSLGILLTIAISTIFTATFDYDNKHVIVTGGSSGIGLECAKLYAGKGANVTIVARDKVKLDNALAEIRVCQLDGRRAMGVSADTGSDQATVDAALSECLRDFGPADVLVNCAGTSIAGEFDKLATSEFERMMRTNLLGSVYPTRAIIEGMKTKGNGRIVFVSSQVGQAAIHGFTAYAASKWALRGLAEAIQMEVKPHGILVSVSYPPDTDTPGYKEEMKTKLELTKKLSESGSVFTAAVVAKDIVEYSAKGYFCISTGLDGWLLKQVHPGMSPINNIWEVAQGILFGPICKIIAVFYILGWQWECENYSKKQKNAEVVTDSHKNQKTPSKGVPTMRVTRNSAKKVL